MASKPPPSSLSFAEQAAALRSCTEAELRAKGLLASNFPPPPRSAADCRAALLAPSSFAARVAATQQLVDSLSYNFSPGPRYHFGVDKTLPFRSLAAKAAAMLADPAPLKCVEAVALALLLTAGWPRVDRFALGFRSRCRVNRREGHDDDDQEEERHRHVVLALRDRATGAWGAIGASRCPLLLGGASASFESLSGLVALYAAWYAAVGHRLDKVRVGSPAPHSLRCARRVSWRALRLPLGRAAFAGAAASASSSSGKSGESGESGGGAWPAAAAALDAFAEAPRRVVAAAAAAVAAAGAPRRATDASLASSVSRLASAAASRRASGAAALSRRASVAAVAGTGAAGAEGGAGAGALPRDGGDGDATLVLDGAVGDAGN